MVSRGRKRSKLDVKHVNAEDEEASALRCF